MYPKKERSTMASNDELSDAAKEMATRGAAKGGRARANVLTDDERSAIARTAGQARWAKAGKPAPADDDAPSDEMSSLVTRDDEMPYSAFPGTVEIGTVTLECHVLNDGRRVLTAREMVRALRGTTSNPPSIQRYLDALPAYQPGMFDHRTVQFRIPGLPQTAFGFEAEVLIDICVMYQDARMSKTLKPGQKRLAEMAEIITSACAKTGIEALIDEATGYQQVREKRALQVKLQAFIAEDMQKWVKTFPDEFWHELARLEGIRYQARHRPLRWGNYVPWTQTWRRN